MTAVLMLFAFVWLAMGSCYIVYFEKASITTHSAATDSEDGTKNSKALPFEDESKEKTETNSNGFGIEFIYDNTIHVFDIGDRLKHYNMHYAGLFIPFIGECIGQPPEPASC